ncbi:phage tail sheath C-terminal domain-containing protein [Saccharopolyspora shandongensis]|uniref:phage tail sheath family protein n=1 Tax=Saccharopolyspora shandongensis TaxID=418495 RepID=UPI003448C5A2
MPEYLSPGIYVEELPSDVLPIQGVSTSTAGFVGLTERGPTQATLITSWPEYQRWYGDVLDPAQSYLPIAVQGFFTNGGQRVFVARVVPESATTATLTLPAEGDSAPTVTAVGPGGWGGRVYVRVSSATNNPRGFRLQVAYYRGRPPETVDVVKFPPTVSEDYDELGADRDAGRFAEGVVNPASHLISLSWPKGKTPSLPRRGEWMPLIVEADDPAVKPTAGDFRGHDGSSGADPTGLAALAAVDEVAILAVPDAVNAALIPDENERRAIVGSVLDQCESLRDRFAILDVEQGASDVRSIAAEHVSRRSDYAAIYYPHLRILDSSTQAPILVPPSGFIAGIYAYNDVMRGVHKAPANYQVQGILARDMQPGVGSLEFTISKGKHDVLNPQGVNVIGDFRTTEQGIRVWGARTISSEPDWAYINVRRLSTYVEESVRRSLQWVVFEPNSESTWARLRPQVDTFLEQVWRDGALMGSTRQEAYFVRCDKTTMSTDDIRNGRLVCLIGLAAVRPEEFVVLRFVQKTIEADT